MKHQIITCNQFDKIEFEPNLVIGFYQDIKEPNFKSHYKKIKQRFPNIDFVACSTESNIYNQIPYVDTDEEHICVYLFLKLKKEAYNISLLKTDEQFCTTNDKEIYDAIVLSSGYSKLLDEDIVLLKAKFGIDNLFGAIAGVSDKNNTPQVFYNGKFYSDSILLLLLEKRFYQITGVSIHQFEPVGFELNITKAKDNVIYELDNRPALDVLDDIVGTITDKKVKSFSFPFFLKKAIYHSFEESPLASIKDFDRVQKTITLYRYIRDQDKLKLSISITSQEQMHRLKKFNNIRQNDGVAFIFNCLGIKHYLGMMEYVYLMDLKRQLKMPFIGFHSFGEVGSIETNSDTTLHNQTISLAVLSPTKDKK
jgi:hypothetical protein